MFLFIYFFCHVHFHWPISCDLWKFRNVLYGEPFCFDFLVNVCLDLGFVFGSRRFFVWRDD